MEDLFKYSRVLFLHDVAAEEREKYKTLVEKKTFFGQSSSVPWFLHRMNNIPMHLK
jgi:hypothetical protein